MTVCVADVAVMYNLHGLTLLFDLKNDPYEREDIAAAHPAVVAQLEKAYQAWDAKNMAPGWFDPHRENVIKEEKELIRLREKASKGGNK